MYYQRYGNKYGAVKTEGLDGYRYDSKFEASVANDLYLRKKAGDILDYDRQFKIEVWKCTEDGERIEKLSHRIDFRVHNTDGSFELVEAKGAETTDWRKRRLWLEKAWLPKNLDHTYTVIKQRSGKR